MNGWILTPQPLFRSGPTSTTVVQDLVKLDQSPLAQEKVLRTYLGSKRGQSDLSLKMDKIEAALTRASKGSSDRAQPTFLKIRKEFGLGPSLVLIPSIAVTTDSDAGAAPPPPPYSGPSRSTSSSTSTPSFAPAPQPTSRAFRVSLNAVPPRSGASSPSLLLVDGEEQLAMLRDYDTVFLVDDSGSMAGGRWREARSAIEGVVKHAMKYDDDGVDIYFLNSKTEGKGLKRSTDVERLFAGVKPSGATPTGRRLDVLMVEYKKELEAARKRGKPAPKPLNIIIITDGVPTDDPEAPIVRFAKYLDQYDFPLSQFGIQMFQIGNDSSAREALEELDDALQNRYQIRDIVDTIPYKGEMDSEDIIKVLLGGINRRLDRKAA
jgi:uncharacterized protein YegL